MKIVVNGESVELLQPTTITQWLNEQNGIPNSTIIEFNGEILSQDQWNSTALRDGDQLEIFLFIGGG